MSGAQAQKGFHFQELFGIYRAFDVYDENISQYIRFENPDLIGVDREEPADIVIIDKDGQVRQEVWQVKKNNVDIKKHINSLVRLRKFGGSECLCGSVQGVPLTKSVESVAALFESLRIMQGDNEVIRSNILSSQFSVIKSQYLAPLVELVTAGGDCLHEDVLRALSLYEICCVDQKYIEAFLYIKIIERLNINPKQMPSESKQLSFILGGIRELIRIHMGKFIPLRSLVDITKEVIVGESSVAEIKDLRISITNKNKQILSSCSYFSNIAINDLYVDQNCLYEYYDFEEKKTVSINVESASSWLMSFLNNDVNFLLLLGDFGQGKTTLLQYMVYIMSQKCSSECPIPIYISLRRDYVMCDLREAIKAAVGEYIHDDDWKSHKWILFCDGFDELSIYNQSRSEWIVNEFNKIRQLSRMNNVKIVLSSRRVLFLGEERGVISYLPRLSLLPFSDDHIRNWLANWSKYNSLITYDMLEQRNLIDVAKIPVILLIICKMFHDTLHHKNKIYSKAEIYRTFFDWTEKTGGLIKDGDIKKHNVPDDYRRILQDISWTIFTHPDSSNGMLNYKVLKKNLDIKGDNEFFKSSGVFISHAMRLSHDNMIEFMHQSLREYLVAERLFNIVYDKNIKKSLRNLLSNRPLTEAKINFFKELLTDKIKKQSDDLPHVFSSMELTSFFNVFYAIRNSGMYDCKKIAKEIDGDIVYDDCNIEHAVAFGNIMLLYFICHTVVHAVLSDKHIVEVSPYIHLIESSLESEKFVMSNYNLIKLFKKSFANLALDCTILVGGMGMRGYSFENSCFKDIKFYETSLESQNFNKCKIDTVVIEQSNVKDVSFKTALVRYIFITNSIITSHFALPYRNVKKIIIKECIFNKSDIVVCGKGAVVFEDCIFIDSSLFGVYVDYVRDNVMFIRCTNIKNSKKVNIKTLLEDIVEC